MNEIVNNFSLEGEKFMPEMLLKQPACRSFTKNKERMQKFHNTFIKTNQIKLVFNMTWLMKFLKYLTRRTAADKMLCDKAFNTVKSRSERSNFNGLKVC